MFPPTGKSLLSRPHASAITVTAGPHFGRLLSADPRPPARSLLESGCYISPYPELSYS